MQEEIELWHAESYAPVALTEQEAQHLGLENLTTAWSDNNQWPTPDWATIIHTQVIIVAPTAEFTILLRNFIIGVSEWQGALQNRDTDSNTKILHTTPSCHMTAAGLVVYYKVQTKPSTTLSLTIDYYANQELHPNIKSTARFQLGR
jgi:hypothetical protein